MSVRPDIIRSRLAGRSAHDDAGVFCSHVAVRRRAFDLAADRHERPATGRWLRMLSGKGAHMTMRPLSVATSLCDVRHLTWQRTDMSDRLQAGGYRRCPGRERI